MIYGKLFQYLKNSWVFSWVNSWVNKIDVYIHLYEYDNVFKNAIKWNIFPFSKDLKTLYMYK